MNLKRVPKWAWIVAALVAVGVFYYMRHRAANNSTGAQSAGASASDSLGSSTGVDTSQLASDVAGQLGSSLGGTPPSYSSGAVSPVDNSQLYATMLQMQAQSFSDYLGTLAPILSAGIVPTSSGTVPGSSDGGPTTAPGAPATSNPQTPTGPAAAKPAAFGGIVSKVKTKTGAIITTYASGRKVEQAPGKSPYVIRK
jgi:hypothetical protein